MSDQTTAAGVRVIHLDGPGPNILDARLTAHLMAELDRVEHDPPRHGVVFASARSDGFLVGPDTDELGALGETRLIAEAIGDRQRLIDRIQALPRSLAAVHGPALGNGFELALACSAMVLSDDDSTCLALPGVTLGLLPSGGGSWRLPARLGLSEGLAHILTGQEIDAEQALARGLALAVVSAEALVETAVGLLETGQVPARRTRARRSWWLRLGEATRFGRRAIYTSALRAIGTQAGTHYPSPLAALKAVEAGMETSPDAAARIEREKLSELLQGPAAQSLIHLSRADRCARRATGPAVTRLGIEGEGRVAYGLMSIAESAGIDVRDDPADGGDLFVHTTPGDSQAVAAARDAFLVASPDGAFAVHGATTTVEELAAGAVQPERVVGVTFFAPVEHMPLVEISRGPATSEETIARLAALAGALDRSPILIGDGVGGYVRRIGAAWIAEALRLLAEGAGPEAVEVELQDAGWPAGPLRMSDEQGLDTLAAMLSALTSRLGPRFAAPDLLSPLVAAGRRGRAEGHGFYSHESPLTRLDLRDLPEAREGEDVPGEAAIRDRSLWAVIIEAHRCLADGVLTDPDTGDLGAVLGVGFPPYTGGPFHYVRALGPAAASAAAGSLATTWGERFATCGILTP